MKLTRAKKDEEAFSAKVLVYRVDGALDGLEATNFLSSVTSDMDAEEPNHIVLVCDDMPYLTSSGLRSIMTIGKRLMGKGGRLVLAGLCGLAEQIVATSGFSTIFPVVADLLEARRTLGGQP